MGYIKGSREMPCRQISMTCLAEVTQGRGEFSWSSESTQHSRCKVKLGRKKTLRSGNCLLYFIITYMAAHKCTYMHECDLCMFKYDSCIYSRPHMYVHTQAPHLSEFSLCRAGFIPRFSRRLETNHLYEHITRDGAAAVWEVLFPSFLSVIHDSN